MKNKKLIPILAIAVLLIGVGTSVFVFLNSQNTGVVTFNGQEFSKKELFALSTEKIIEEFSGIALDTLMMDLGISDPEDLEYTFIASDGYQKTVFWENMQNGILTNDMMSVFSDLPKAFRVKDIIEIKAE